jgi:carboxypeptidase C (cathepsin A)
VNLKTAAGGRRKEIWEMMTQSSRVQETRKVWMAITLLFLPCLLIGMALAQEPKTTAPPAQTAPREFVTHHRLDIGKEPLSYTAIAGETVLLGQDGAPEASFFSIAYVKEGVVSPDARPVTFLFNGGPGSSSAWLHLGAFGPRRLVLSDDPVIPGAPPYLLVDNTDTLLRYTDLVFVDPIGTGYSHALGKAKDKDYWGVDEDSAIIAKFIRAYITANKRWNSPKYLAGESYGTIRACVLVRDLELKLLDSLNLNGVILLSVALDPRTFMPGGPGNELPYVTNLPTYAATAHFHNMLPQPQADLDAFLRRVEDFASSEYLAALFKGDALPADQQEAIAEKLHQFTGLSIDYLKRTHLRIDEVRFRKELLRSRGLVMAIYDTRYTGKDLDEAGEQVQFDPFFLGIAGPFVAAMNNYLTAELNVKIDQPYVVFSEEAAGGWKRARDGNFVFAGFLNMMPYLAQAAATNKDFHVFAASGLYDLTTAYYGTQYIFNQSGINKERLTLKTYAGGHMMYTYLPSLRQLTSDIAAFMNPKQ